MGALALTRDELDPVSGDGFYARHMAADGAKDFPLFPLGIVALPHEAVPLHIFEERYKSMIAFCLEHEHEFGIVWADDDGVHDVGCAVIVEEVLDRTTDGRMDILCRGTRPFELISRSEKLEFPTGEIEFLDDSEDGESADSDGEETRALYSQLYEEATDEEIADDDLAAMDSYAMAATVEFGKEAKQTLLELRSESDRLGMLAKLFRAALKRVEDIGRAEALARSNGKVRFGSVGD